ncbi:hypothetical protein MRX96_003112 [Rhipicephalus microplus]
MVRQKTVFSALLPASEPIGAVVAELSVPSRVGEAFHLIWIVVEHVCRRFRAVRVVVLVTAARAYLQGKEKARLVLAFKTAADVVFVSRKLPLLLLQGALRLPTMEPQETLYEEE